MSAVPVQIVRRQGKTLVDALLHTELKPKVLVDTEKEWGPIRLAAARRLQREGKVEKIPQHFLWDWERKSQKLEYLAYRCCGIECEGKIQGLLMVNFAGKQARLEPDKGKQLVYIEYLESAPWNLGMMVDAPLYGLIGPILMSTAIQLSHEEEFHGRIGLHALEQSEEFYRDDCGMHGCGPDATYDDLPYYEMTREIAARYMSKSSGGAA